ncbi:MAG: serine/threonine-protein kinase, partial [Planctomycetota bacterium]
MSDSIENNDELLEQVTEEFTNRTRKGEVPSIEEYATRYPEIADRIEEILPSIAMMERLGQQQHSELKTAQHLAGKNAFPVEKLGDYRILREIGRGGMGIVLEAIQESLGRLVAVKVLSKQAMLDRKHIARFGREAKTASKLHHSNIVPVFGVGQNEGYHYYVMQRIEGVGLDRLIKQMHTCLSQDHYDFAAAPTCFSFVDEIFQTPCPTDQNASTPMDFGPQDDTLADWGHLDSRSAQSKEVLEKSGCLSRMLGPSHFREVAEIGSQVSKALQYAHQQGVLHRDIKPGNLLLSRRRVVWVADFGLAKALEQNDVSRTGDIVGTLRY